MKQKIPHVISQGFTLIELLVVMTIFATLMTLITLNLSHASSQTTLQTTIATLLADIHAQQLRAMTGDTGGLGANSSYGIQFSPTSYTLFQGTTFDSQHAANVTIQLSDTLRFSTISLPNTQVIFASGSGAFTNYTSDNNHISIQDIANGTTKTIQFNRYGIVVGVD